MSALENFGFSTKGINQKVLFEACLSPRGPKTGFLRSAYCGFKAPLDILLLEQMNPAEILGVASGFFVTAKNERGQNQSDWRPAFLYTTMQERAKKHYGVELEKIDDLSHERKVRPYTGDLHDRLSSVKLSDERRKKIMDGSVEYERDIRFVHDPGNGLYPSNSVMKLYIKNLFSNISSKYGRYEAETQKDPIDMPIQPDSIQS
jgi:hypothetical protein